MTEPNAHVEKEVKPEVPFGTGLIIIGVVCLGIGTVLGSSLFYFCGPCHPLAPWISLAFILSGIILLVMGAILRTHELKNKAIA
ncbi:MAG: hypothetical protein ACFFBR_01330 [Promethearchaeota archaeon]